MKPAIGDRDMATEKKVNYTEEQTAELIQRYQAGESVEGLAEALGRAKRSIIAKLVREGVYQTPEKQTKAKRDEGPTKKELLNDLEALVDFDVNGLMGATKEAIAAVIALAQRMNESDSQEAFNQAA
jgi:hypothetical protein